MARSLAITGNVLASDRDAYYEAKQTTRDVSGFDISDILDDGYWDDMGLSEKKNLTKLEATENMQPHKFDPLIEQAANNAGISPQVLKSLVITESNFRPDVKSSAGALGLTQLTAGTARDVADKLGLKTYDLTDPATNLKMGAFYLTEKLKAFDGDLPLALTAYHSGEARVKRLLRQKNGSSLEDIIDGLGPAGKAYARSILDRIGDV
jgi:soluble lytic murein transglycosylase